MYFKLFKRQYRGKRAAEDRRRNCAVLPCKIRFELPVKSHLRAGMASYLICSNSYIRRCFLPLP